VSTNTPAFAASYRGRRCAAPVRVLARAQRQTRVGARYMGSGARDRLACNALWTNISHFRIMDKTLKDCSISADFQVNSVPPLMRVIECFFAVRATDRCQVTSYRIIRRQTAWRIYIPYFIVHGGPYFSFRSVIRQFSDS
jgi:hypothetical protein